MRTAARDPRIEARRIVGPGLDPRVLEPSPPAVVGGQWADDPVADAPSGGGPPVLSPVAGRGQLTWADWAADHDDLAGWCADRWLGPHRRLAPPPDALPSTRLALHRLAVAVLSPARQRAADGRMALRWTMGGFGTPFFGADEQVRVVDARLVRQSADGAEEATITTLDAAAAFVLDGPPDVAWAAGLDVPATGDPSQPLAVDPVAASWLGDWFGFAWSVLEELRADAASADASRVQLWPEHFDAAFECLPDGRRAGFGLSPGDATTPQPYAYVTLWHPDEAPASPLFDATAFAGAVLPLAAFVEVEDQREVVLRFLRERRDALVAG